MLLYFFATHAFKEQIEFEAKKRWPLATSDTLNPLLVLAPVSMPVSIVVLTDPITLY